MHSLTALFLSALMLMGCTFSNDIDGVGEVDCVGLGEEEDPRAVYEVNGWNIFWGVVFSELLLIPPIVVLTSAWTCPERARQPGGAATPLPPARRRKLIGNFGGLAGWRVGKVDDKAKRLERADVNS